MDVLQRVNPIDMHVCGFDLWADQKTICLTMRPSERRGVRGINMSEQALMRFTTLDVLQRMAGHTKYQIYTMKQLY